MKTKKFLKHIIYKLRNEDGYIEILFMIVIFFFLISVLISVAPPFITRNKLTTISKRVIEKVEFDGKITADTNVFVNDLIQRANLQNKNTIYSFSGNIRPNGKIQLRDEFTFSITSEEKINLTGIGVFNIVMNIKKEDTGVSEVFYKSSEL